MPSYGFPMGNVIRIDNKSGSTPSVLTETGTGGLLSAGTLRERPAVEYLEADERPVFVLTNRKRGVEIARPDGTERISSGKGYRTVAVLTDRRLVVLVGDSDAESVDGDQRLTVQFVDVEVVSADGGRRDGRLTVRCAGGKTITVHCGSDGLDDAASYLTDGSQAWIHVENALDEVKRSLVAATEHRNAGEYDAALDAAREAYHGVNEPRLRANEFDSEWGAGAMIDRVDDVQADCVERLTEVRLGRANRFTDEAESNWRDDRFESAHDEYERAIAELDTILTYDTGAVPDREAVREELERVEGVVAELEEAPLGRAVEADRAAMDAEDPVDAADHWTDALERYRVAMELDWGADERRFAGDPDAIRERLADVVDRLVAARRSAATAAKRAGDWYVGAEQFDVAVEEFEAARDQYELALSVARERYPDATDHLTVERDAVEDRLERARAARDGENLGPAQTGDEDVKPDLEPSAEAAAGDEPVVSDGGTTGHDAADVPDDDLDVRVDDGIEQ